MWGWTTILIGVTSASFWSVLLATEGRPQTKLIALTGLSMTLLGLVTFVCLWHFNADRAGEKGRTEAGGRRNVDQDWQDVLDAAAARP